MKHAYKQSRRKPQHRGESRGIKLPETVNVFVYYRRYNRITCPSTDRSVTFLRGSRPIRIVEALLEARGKVVSIENLCGALGMENSQRSRTKISRDISANLRPKFDHLLPHGGDRLQFIKGGYILTGVKVMR